jgi:ribonuclease P protein component
MISFDNRFHGHSSLGYIYRNGQTVRSRLLTLKTIINQHHQKTRVAVVVSKKVLKSAVKRNRIRRQIYEYVRPKLPLLKNVYDIVIIVSSSELLTMPYPELTMQLDQLFNQSGILTQEPIKTSQKLL